MNCYREHLPVVPLTPQFATSKLYTNGNEIINLKIFSEWNVCRAIGASNFGEDF